MSASAPSTAGSSGPPSPTASPWVACDACTSDEDKRVFGAREMMFGLRDRFRYQECASCGHLQLLDIPADLARYYPSSYYSLDSRDVRSRRRAGYPARLRSELLLRLPARICDRLVGWHVIDPAYGWLAGLGISTRSRICDVGSGGGELLIRMVERGFRELVGLDPHVQRDIEVAPSVWVRKLSVEQLDGQFDVILLNHSFEHMEDPATVLACLRNRLTAAGALVVRVPLAGSHAWRRYGADWVGLDPPRHIFVPTERSMRLLAQQAGLDVVRVFHDSHALQFWGSEQYRRDVPLHDRRSWIESPGDAHFSRRDVVRWHAKARRLNADGDGDSGGFVLRRAEIHPGPPGSRRAP